MNDMLTVIKALAPNTAEIVHRGDACILITDRWPGRDERYTIHFSRQPGGVWSVLLALSENMCAFPRRLKPFRCSDVLRLTRFFADPLRWFLKTQRS